LGGAARDRVVRMRRGRPRATRWTGGTRCTSHAATAPERVARASGGMPHGALAGRRPGTPNMNQRREQKPRSIAQWEPARADARSRVGCAANLAHTTFTISPQSGDGSAATASSTASCSLRLGPSAVRPSRRPSHMGAAVSRCRIVSRRSGPAGQSRPRHVLWRRLGGHTASSAHNFLRAYFEQRRSGNIANCRAPVGRPPRRGPPPPLTSRPRILEL
jgi:hypothetical protein